MSSHSERLAALYHLNSGASTSRSTTARRQAKATKSAPAKATKSPPAGSRSTTGRRGAKAATATATPSPGAAQEAAIDETEWAKAIGAHVRRLRSAREDGGKSVGGVGQDRPEVARRLGVSTATLSRWEAEAPTLWLQLARLAAVLGVTTDELLNPPGLKGATGPRPRGGPPGP